MSTRLGFQKSSWRRAGREGLWVLAGQASVALAGLIGIRILTELAHKRVLGEVSLLMGALGLAKGVLMGPLTSAQIRLHPEYAAKGQAAWFERVTSRWTWRAAGLSAFLLMLGDLIWNWTRHLGPWGVVMPVVLAMVSLVDAIKTVRIGILGAQRRQARIAIWSGSEAWMWTGAAAAYLYFLGRTPESYLAGQLAGSYLALLLVGMLWRAPKCAQDIEVAPSERDLWTRVRAFALPLLPLGIVGWITNLADRYILGGIDGLADVGVYTAAYSLASRPILIAGSALFNLVRPILFQAASSGRNDAARRIFALWLLATTAAVGLMVLLFALLGPLIARAFLAAEYRARAPALMIWIAAAYAVYNISTVVEARLLSHGVSHKTVLPNVAAAVTNTVANLLLIPRYGALGAAIATFIAYCIHLTFMSASLLMNCKPASGGIL